MLKKNPSHLNEQKSQTGHNFKLIEMSFIPFNHYYPFQNTAFICISLTYTLNLRFNFFEKDHFLKDAVSKILATGYQCV